MLLSVFVAATLFAGPKTVARFPGSAFEGGGKVRYGATYDGVPVNFIYGKPTGPLAQMAANFTLERLPGEPVYLYLKGRDDDGPGQASIQIWLNGVSLFAGPNGYPQAGWTSKRFNLPTSSLKLGENELRIVSLDTKGEPGMPPWFMVSEVAIAPAGYDWKLELEKDFHVDLPTEKREFPEPLKPGEQPGFKFRGIKGWIWLPEKYLEIIPHFKKLKLNFLMNCYGSYCDVEHYPWGHPKVNRWWEPPQPEKAKAYEKIVRACQKEGIAFCFSMNPNLFAEHPLKYDSEEDFQKLWAHYGWMQNLGVKWFNVSLDDISQGIDASGQAKLINKLFAKLREKDVGCQFIFCPTFYWGDGTDKDARPYLEVLAKELNPDVYVFWTGDKVVGPITRKAAETYKGIVKHRIFIWDNYPVNDDNPTMHLGPVILRDPDVCEFADGYMSNSMCKQTEGDLIPLATCADYAYNPRAYDPGRSIGQAILLYGQTKEQREVLRELVELYPGCLLYEGVYCNFNPVRDSFNKIMGLPHSRAAASGYIDHLADVLSRFEKSFPKRFGAEKRTLRDDLQWARTTLRAKYGG